MSQNISLNSISFGFEKPIFTNINLTFDEKICAIVGQNGCRKSTLAKIIANILKPNSGKILGNESIFYFSQNNSNYEKVSDILEISHILSALKRVKKVEYLEEDFNILDENWDLQERFSKLFKEFNLKNIELEQNAKKLSSGEIKKLRIISAFLRNEKTIIFDEPSNFLDISSKKQFIKALKQSSKNFILISHDFEILNEVNLIIELNNLGAKKYYGGFKFYLTQKEIEKNIALENISKIEKNFDKKLQNLKEKMVKASKISKNADKKNINQSKIILDKTKNNSQKSSEKLKVKEAKLTQNFEK